jgi:hypothetical protein
MAYNLKYKLTSATKNDTISIVEMYIDEVVEDVIEYDAVLVNLQYIPKSDDIYESIYASQLSVIMDITDDVNNQPNFVTLNDRKYLVKLKIDGTVIWTGWALSDNVQYLFTTGRKQLRFDAIDGLGILDYFPYPFVEGGMQYKFSPIKTLDFITNCLNQIAFPDGLNVYTVCSYYSQYMNDRADNTYDEPFNQSYLRPNYFLNSDDTYQTCLEVLSKIVKSFGCRLYQANNKWNIVAINEMASTSYYYTEYIYNGTLSSSGTASITSTIEPYVDNTSGMYFVDNSQVKIFKKGYNNFIENYTLEYSPNYIANNNLKLQSSGVPILWNNYTNGVGGSITTIVETYETSDRFRLVTGVSSGGALGYTYVSATVPSALQNDTIVYSNTFYNQEIEKKRGFIKLQVTGAGSGAPIYYYNVDKIWQDASIAPFDNYYLIEEASQNDINNFSITTPPLPISGQLTMQIQVFDSASCSTEITIGDFILTFQSPISSIKTTSILNDNNQYTFNMDLPFGYPTYSGDGVNRSINNQALGTILVLHDTIYLAASGWYKYGVLGIFQGLSQLIMKEYINAYRRNLINVDSNVFGIETSNGRFSAGKILRITDTDPAQISVEDKFFMTGNMTIDIVNSEIQSTLLDISNEAIESSILTIYTVNGINYN